MKLSFGGEWEDLNKGVTRLGNTRKQVLPLVGKYLVTLSFYCMLNFMEEMIVYIALQNCSISIENTKRN